MVVLTPIERETLLFFFFFNIQMLNVSTFGNTADIYAIIHLVPHACQHITVDQRATAAVIRLRKSGDWREVEAQRHCPSQTPRRKCRTGLKPGTGVATALTRHFLFLCVLSIFMANFDWDTLAHLCNEPESRLVCLVLIQLWHQPVF